MTNSFEPITERRQDLRLSRNTITMFTALLHLSLCFLLWQGGYFRVTLKEFIALFCIFWVGDLILYYSILFGFKASVREQMFTIPHIVWTFTCVIITTYLANDLRMTLLILCPLTLTFSSFRLTLKMYIILTILLILMYSTVIFALSKFHPEDINLQKEYIRLISFTLISIFCAIAGYEMMTLRYYLHKKNKALSAALKQIEEISVTDELTGIKNRRYILDILAQQRLIAERQPQLGFSICLMDIDDFKHINDTYGHPTGDKLLINFSNEIMQLMRKTDYFSRYGGEEFLLVSPFSTKENTLLFCERIREHIANTTLLNTIREKITMSIGVTEYQPNEPLQETLLRSDRALYLAKKQGKNQVTFL